MFDDAVITEAGVALLSRWAGGGRLTIDGAAAGDATVDAASLMVQTAIAAPRQTLPIADWRASDTGIEYNVQFTAADAAYTARQIGVYAHLDDGERTLIALFQDEAGIFVPSKAEMPDFVFAFYATLQMSATGEIDVTVNADRYVHPTTPGNRHIPAGGAAGQILRWSADGTAEWGEEKQTQEITVDGTVTDGGKNPVSGAAVAAYVKEYVQKQIDEIVNFEEVSF